MKAFATVAALGLMFGGATAASAQMAATAPTDMPEGRARMLMMEACGNVSTLSRDSQGHWHGSCSKGNMMVGADGKVVEDKLPAGWITEAHARSLASDFCGNVSTLAPGPNHSWLGNCSKGNIVVDQSGKVATR